MSKKRELNMEILRAISMFLVVILHALGHGGVLASYEINSAGYIVFWFLETLAFISVNCFILISGYFMIYSEMTISKIIKILLQVEIYSILGSLVGCIVFKLELNPGNLLVTLFPLTNNIYWFVAKYVLLMIISPFLNKFLLSLERKEYEKLLLVLIGVFSVIPSILPWSKGVICDGYDVIWFTVLYIIAAYFRIYDFKLPKQSIWLYFVLAAIGVISRLLIGNITINIFGHESYTDLLYSYNSVLVIAMSLIVFNFFRQLDIKDTKFSKIILFLSANSFGVYLWHEHFMLRWPVWSTLNIPQKTSEGIGITLVYLIVAVSVIYLIGCTIEFLRLKIFALCRGKKQ